MEEEGWEPTLLYVMAKIERKAIKHNLGKLVATGASQNSLETGGTRSSRNRKRKKDKKKGDQISVLKQSVADLTKKVESQNSQQATKRCPHQAKCWKTNCPLGHAPGHKPAVYPYKTTCGKCGKKGHDETQCGKCFNCGSDDHMYKECDKPKTWKPNVHQNVQEPKQSEEKAEDDEAEVMMRL